MEFNDEIFKKKIERLNYTYAKLQREGKGRFQPEKLEKYHPSIFPSSTPILIPPIVVENSTEVYRHLDGHGSNQHDNRPFKDEENRQYRVPSNHAHVKGEKSLKTHEKILPIDGYNNKAGLMTPPNKPNNYGVQSDLRSSSNSLSTINSQKKTKNASSTMDKWVHDLYNEEEQSPRAPGDRLNYKRNIIQETRTMRVKHAGYDNKCKSFSQTKRLNKEDKDVKTSLNRVFNDGKASKIPVDLTVVNTKIQTNSPANKQMTAIDQPKNEQIKNLFIRPWKKPSVIMGSLPMPMPVKNPQVANLLLDVQVSSGKTKRSPPAIPSDVVLLNMRKPKLTI